MIFGYCEYNNKKCKTTDAIDSIFALKELYSTRLENKKFTSTGKVSYPKKEEATEDEKQILENYNNRGKIFLKDITKSACVLLENNWNGILDSSFEFCDQATDKGFNHYGRATQLWGSQDIAVNIGCRWDKEKPNKIVIYTNVDIENSCSNRVRVNELTTSLQESFVKEGFANGIIEFGAISLGWRDNKNVESAPVLIPEFEMELTKEISSKYDYIENIYKSFVILKAISKYLNTTNAQKQDKWQEKIVNLVFSLKVANDLELDLSSTVMKINDLILEDNKQIILTGAPGTGKTYSSLEYIRWQLLSEHLKEINKKGKTDYNNTVVEIKNNLKESDHKKKSEYFKKIIGDKWAMVQFHPSFDYTDFVEGLRPAKIEVNQVQPATEGKKPTVSASTQTSFVKMEGVFKKFCRKVAEDGGNSNNRYFFIDEVNRADLSKVFGELMYCLEEGYRGPEHSVKTQYSNLETYSINDGEEFASRIPDTVFKDGFYIPDNIIIIGSMNDIDRSVDTFDFALRRRFRWINIKVTEGELVDTFRSMNKKAGASVDDISIVGYAKRIMKMNRIFESDDYKKMFGTPEDYYIGPAYFKSYFDGDSEDEIWGSKIVPLLREYVRGREEGESFITDCEEAYKVNTTTGTSKDDVLNSIPTKNIIPEDQQNEVANLLSKLLTRFDRYISEENLFEQLNSKQSLRTNNDLKKRVNKLFTLFEEKQVNVQLLKNKKEIIVNAFIEVMNKNTDQSILDNLKETLLKEFNESVGTQPDTEANKQEQ